MNCRNARRRRFSASGRSWDCLSRRGGLTSLERQNVSSQRMRKSKVRAVLMDAPGSRFIRRRFIPQAWRDRVKRRWMPAKRPECSDATRAKVEAIFDEDLATLGGWLGIDLNCANFKERTAAAPPPWTAEAGR